MERNRLFCRFAALSVGAVMLLSLASCAKAPAETTAPKKSVTAEQAVTELQEQSVALGFNNALDELVEKNTASIGGDTYIRLQQNYEGIPVYGKTIVYAANEQGELASVTGNVQDIDPNINLTPSITSEQAQESIRKYASEVLEQAATNISSSEPIVCIYNGNKLAYAYTVTIDSNFFAAHEVLVDAHDASILEWNTYAASFDTNQDVLEAADVACESDDSHNLKLTDIRRNHSVHHLNRSTSNQYPTVEAIVSNDNFLATVVPDQAASGETYALVHLAQTSDFYADVLDRQSYDNLGGTVYLFSCEADLLADNGKSLACPEYGVIMLGEPVSKFSEPLAKAMDLVAHEYAHLIFQTEVGLSTDLDVSSVNEGIADIFGNLIELYVNGEQDTSWPLAEDAGHVKYNMADPMTMGSYGDEEHNNAQILSHSAYLMWNGIDGTESKSLSEQQLAELWYRAVLMMPSDCDFILCRQLVEVAAQSMENLTDEQRACVREAFDRVGIASSRGDDFHADYLLAEDATLSVYDQNNEPYSGYTLRISGSIDMKEIASNMTPDIGWVVNRTVTVEEAGAYALDLPQGRYTLTITATHYDETYTIYVEISAKHEEANIDLITAYEEPLIVVISPQKQILRINEYDESGELYANYEYSYNDSGQISAFTVSGPYADPTRNSTYSYDSDGRLLEGNGNKYKYNENGLVESAKLAFGQGYYEYDDQGNLIKSTEVYDMQTDVASYFYGDNGTLAKKVSYTYPVGSMHENPALNSEDAVITTYTYDYDNQNRVVAERWEYNGTKYCTTYDYSYNPFTIVTHTYDEHTSDVMAVVIDPNGNWYSGIYLSYGSEPEYFVDDGGYLIKAIGDNGEKRIFEFSYSNDSYEDSNLIDTSNLQDVLLNYWWENNIQCPLAYRFLADGTLLEYFEVGSDYVSRSLKYELNGNTVSIGDDSGYYTELKLVYPTDNIAWDQGVGHDFTELPNSQGFLYEVGFVETDLPENAMYLIPTAPVITP